MATFTPFVPTTAAPFQFNPTLDGQVYLAVITWNIFGRRFYLNVYTLGNVLVCAVPMVGSPTGYDISLVAGYFATSTLVFRTAANQFEVSP